MTLIEALREDGSALCKHAADALEDGKDLIGGALRRIRALEDRVSELEREIDWHREYSEGIFNLIRQAAAIEAELHKRRADEIRQKINL